LNTQSILSAQTPLGTPLKIVKQTFLPFQGKPVKRVSFLAGLHGDELEGVYLCYLLIDHLRKLKEQEPEAFTGEINIYPAVNPQAIGTATRLSPFWSADMNRQLGANKGHSLPAVFSQILFDDLKTSSELVVDFHASNLYLKELPQIRIVEGFEKKLVPLAMHCNSDLIWVHPESAVFESTLGYNLNRQKVPTLVMETGICLRIHQEYCNQIFQGMLHLLHHTQALSSQAGPPTVKDPLLLNPSEVCQIQAGYSGLFIGSAQLGDRVAQGDVLGKIVDPVRGVELENIFSPASGLIFTLREHPIVYRGAPLARIALKSEEPA